MPSFRASATALLLATTQTLITGVTATTFGQYLDNAVNASDVLNQNWYDQSTGQWSNDWWNSANALTALANLAKLDGNFKSYANSYFTNTHTAAANSNGGSFDNGYYDDEGWWAMAFIRLYDVMSDGSYLNTAESIFEDMKGGWGATCGGHWWDKAHTENTAIANALFINVAAALANRVSGKQSYYQNYATEGLNFYMSAGFIQSDNTIIDHLDLSTCKPEGHVWTYNSGAIIGALVEMNKLTGNGDYMTTANNIAAGTMAQLTQNGILVETAASNPPDLTADQFKGVFARNLMYLDQAQGNGNYVSFIQKNADSIWSNDRQDDGQLGPDWQGPYYAANMASQSSAIDCLVAAASLTPQ